MLPYSVACERNKTPILEVLRKVLGGSQDVLEIGTGTAQHAVYFASALPHLVWHTSDLPEHHPGIVGRLQQEGPDNVRPPVALDVCQSIWPVDTVDAIFSANTLHIMAWREVECFFSGVGRVLTSPGTLCVYGPFRYGDTYTSESNARFDRSLRTSDPNGGIRDFEAVDELAAAQGLVLAHDYPMPANNQLVVWTR